MLAFTYVCAIGDFNSKKRTPVTEEIFTPLLSREREHGQLLVQR